MTREERNKEQQDELDTILSREKRKNIVFTALKILIIVIILFLAFYYYTRYISTGGLIVKEQRIINTKIPNNFNGTKVIQFSDLLYGTTVDDKMLKTLVKTINDRKPDIVIYNGNLIDSEYSVTSKDQEKIIKYFKSINASYGKYAVFGNQDNESYRTIMNQSNFKILSNSYDLIYNDNSNPIRIIGLDSLLRDRQNIRVAFSNKYVNTYTITMMNETDTIEEVCSNNPDLVLAGNSLNGTIKIPFVGGLIRKDGSSKYINSHYKINDTEVYVTSGIGTNGIGFRLNNHPSINFFRLSNK